MARTHKQVERLGDLLTVGEAAEYLGVSASTLRIWDRAGKVQAARHPVNGYRLYSKKDLDDLVSGIHRRQEAGSSTIQVQRARKQRVNRGK
jgi:excisionase family DNA binding protein